MTSIHLHRCHYCHHYRYYSYSFWRPNSQWPISHYKSAIVESVLLVLRQRWHLDWCYYRDRWLYQSRGRRGRKEKKRVYRMLNRAWHSSLRPFSRSRWFWYNWHSYEKSVAKKVIFFWFVFGSVETFSKHYLIVFILYLLFLWCMEHEYNESDWIMRVLTGANIIRS